MSKISPTTRQSSRKPIVEHMFFTDSRQNHPLHGAGAPKTALSRRKFPPAFIPKLFLATLLIALQLLCIPPASAKEAAKETAQATAKETGNKEEIDFLYDFLSGTYVLVGRAPESSRTYTGKMLLSGGNGKFEVTRIIEGKTVKGTGRIETATGDRIKVVRVRFTEGGKKYETTYLIGSDLDNYGRLSGYLYLKQGNTVKPGLEVLFIDHGVHD